MQSSTSVERSLHNTHNIGINTEKSKTPISQNPVSTFNLAVMWSDTLLIVGISVFTALLGEGFTWLLVYRTEKYTRLKTDLEKQVHLSFVSSLLFQLRPFARHKLSAWHHDMRHLRSITF